ncbi:GNAT family N-acetyltransferase [Atlantibacter sp.]|uniref:GNAT family N-acetyltransferase n=1 Tax=Atlantibacter sp. TaxID=1903473 RepID=UPI0028A85005|nr:GNAT family N-acetyltransferase [Atlantibacter sp.]
MGIKVTQPVLLTQEHDLTEFDCGNAALNDWLVRRAFKNQTLNASRTFVTCQAGTHIVVGYYCLASGSVDHTHATRGLRQNMPDPIPVILLGRLAVDVAYQRHKVGQWLLKDATDRVEKVAGHVGVKAIMVHAIDEKAMHFYQHYGFVQSVISPNTLLYRLS